MSIEKVTIEKTSKFAEKKDGTPYATKAGKPFKMGLVTFKDGRGASCCLFDEKLEKQFDELYCGLETSLNLTQNGKYTNFTFPKREDMERMSLMGKVAKLESQVEKLMEHAGLTTAEPKDEPMPESEPYIAQDTVGDFY